MNRQRWIIALLAAMSLAAACSKEESSEEGKKQESDAGVPANWKFRLPQGDPAAGRTVFVEMECYKCHPIKGENFPGMAESEKGVGPELSQMGRHPVEFLAESIINPNATIEPEDKELGYLGEDGRSKMPDFNDILTVKQVADLAAYLASLKGEQHKGH
ncbi:MAG: c-type cytochrome [Candidatus Binatia bacterium]